MPARVITKPPTAELRPGQKDEDSLPPYSVLDRILEGLVDKEMSVSEVADCDGRGCRAGRRHRNASCSSAEYKRRQAPPGVKIGNRNFGRDRRYPISNFFHTGPRNDRRHPLRAVADRPAACRQYPHGAAQFPVREEAWRPLPAAHRRHRPRALDRRVRRGDPRRSRLARAEARRRSSASPSGSTSTNASSSG